MPRSRKRKISNYQRIQARNRREEARKVNDPAIMQIYEEIPLQPKPGAIVKRRDGRRYEVQADSSWRRVWAADVEREAA